MRQCRGESFFNSSLQEMKGGIDLKAGVKYNILIEFCNIRAPADGDEDETVQDSNPGVHLGSAEVQDPDVKMVEAVKLASEADAVIAIVNSALTRLDHPISTLPLRLTLKERDIEDVERHLYNVSRPKSASWGKHWSSADVVRSIATSDKTIADHERHRRGGDGTRSFKGAPSMASSSIIVHPVWAVDSSSAKETTFVALHDTPSPPLTLHSSGSLTHTSYTG